MPLRRADDRQYTLANAQTVSSGTALQSVAIPGGEYTLFVEASTLSTISLQMQSPSGSWIEIQMFASAAVRINSGTSLCQIQIDLPAGNVRLFAVNAASATVSGYLVGAG